MTTEQQSSRVAVVDGMTQLSSSALGSQASSTEKTKPLVIII